jgi:magnesium transporter
MPGVVNCVAYRDGQRICDVEVPDISEVLKQKDRFIWIGLHEPGADLLREIQQEFGLHELAIEDALTAHQRPKLEQYGDSLFVVMRTAHLEENKRIEFGETHIFVGDRYVVTVRHGFPVSYAQVRARAEATPRLLKGPGFVLYALMDFIVDQYFPVMDELEDELDQIEELVFSERVTRETTSQMHELKRKLLEFKKAVSPLVEMCNRLMRSDQDIVPDDTQPYFRDVYDHVLRINERVDSTRELLSSVLEANLSLVSVEQSEAMKKLAAWAAIIAVPTMVAGIYGMNFEFMPELRWRFGYPVILALTVTGCVVLFRKFKQAGWL